MGTGKAKAQSLAQQKKANALSLDSLLAESKVRVSERRVHTAATYASYCAKRTDGIVRMAIRVHGRQKSNKNMVERADLFLFFCSRS